MELGLESDDLGVTDNLVIAVCKLPNFALEEEEIYVPATLICIGIKRVKIAGCSPFHSCKPLMSSLPSPFSPTAPTYFKSC